jgi:Na+-driven multidrug efflux pump
MLYEEPEKTDSVVLGVAAVLCIVLAVISVNGIMLEYGLGMFGLGLATFVVVFFGFIVLMILAVAWDDWKSASGNGGEPNAL